MVCPWAVLAICSNYVFDLLSLTDRYEDERGAAGADLGANAGDSRVRGRGINGSINPVAATFRRNGVYIFGLSL